MQVYELSVYLIRPHYNKMFTQKDVRILYRKREKQIMFYLEMYRLLILYVCNTTVVTLRRLIFIIER